MAQIIQTLLSVFNAETLSLASLISFERLQMLVVEADKHSNTEYCDIL